ncbi:MAG: hypothetical protein QM650_10945 [Microlunatus sp.]
MGILEMATRVSVELPEGPEAVAQLADLLRDRTWTALTGAGASTDSGIPDYRGPTSVLRACLVHSVRRQAQAGCGLLR